MRRLLIGMIVWVFQAPALAEVTMNEILADPASDWNGDGDVSARDDEWIEIANLTSQPIDLTGVRIASADTTWRYEFAGVLSPMEVRVVYGLDAWEWERETGNPAFGLRLTNTGGTVGLWRLTDSDTTQIELITYLDEEAEDDRSAGRLQSDPGEWVLFDARNPYDGEPPPYSTRCDPTPGFTNECLVPALEQSWGRIKAIYSGDWAG